ncbi:hypothetical protein AeNC1_007316, partial [Aphanomyces euteiches]
MDYAETLRRSPVFQGSFEPSKNDLSSHRGRHDSPFHEGSGRRHELQPFNLDLPKRHASPHRTAPPEKAATEDIPVLCERQVTIIVLLARVCTVYDATPKTFVANVLRLHRLGIIDSIAFLSDLGLLPTSPVSSPRNSDYIELWDHDNSLDIFPQALNMSRYARDFDEMGLLGQGGFGQVFKARHKLDGICYAIKQVQFLNKGFQSPLVQNVLREVHCLARCDHPNVNRYFGAWLEPTWMPLGPNLSPAPPSSVSLSSIETKQEHRELLEDIRRFVDIKSDDEKSGTAVNEFSSLSISRQSYISIDDDENDVAFEFFAETSVQSNFSDLPMFEPEGKKKKQSQQTTSSLVVEVPQSTPLDLVPIQKTHGRRGSVPLQPWLPRDNKVRSLPRLVAQEVETDANSGADTISFTYHVTLYIQMQLCDQSTLHDWIEARNMRKQPIQVEHNLTLIRQLVDGLHHVHENGIIHRDLKPSNIFMTRDGSIKIGDFGLSKLLAEVMQDQATSGDGLESASVDLRHTQGVGTMSYASPEQVAGQVYDVKVDSFSLGVIVLELFVPFETKMERASTLQDLRVHPCRLPPLVMEKYPKIAILIQHLVAPAAVRWSMPETKAYLAATF